MSEEDSSSGREEEENSSSSDSSTDSDVQAFCKKYGEKAKELEKEMDEKAKILSPDNPVMAKGIDPYMFLTVQGQVQIVQEIMKKSKKKVKKMEKEARKEEKKERQRYGSPQPGPSNEGRKKKKSKSKKKFMFPPDEDDSDLEGSDDEYLMEVHEQVEMFLLRQLQKKQREVLTKFDKLIEQAKKVEKEMPEGPPIEHPYDRPPINTFDKMCTFFTSFFYGH